MYIKKQKKMQILITIQNHTGNASNIRKYIIFYRFIYTFSIKKFVYECWVLQMFTLTCEQSCYQNSVNIKIGYNYYNLQIHSCMYIQLQQQNKYILKDYIWDHPNDTTYINRDKSDIFMSNIRTFFFNPCKLSTTISTLFLII